MSRAFERVLARGRKTARKGRAPSKAMPSEADVRNLVKETLGENGQATFFYDGRIWMNNEEDFSIGLELESTSKAEARRLAVVVLEAVGKYRRERA